ncbi:MAG TPA: MFS transporter, partial [Chloroflexota bacterium]|nr:MFS transporter [Chloroflexota bacterium]
FPVVAPYARSLGAGPLGVALVIASYDAANLVGNLGAGYVLDGWGRKRALVCGLLVAAGCLLLYGTVTTPLQLGLVRGFHGLAQAILSPGAFAVLSDAVPPARRAQAMGTAGVFIAAAAVAGPPLAGILADRRGPEAVFLAVALVLAAVALVVARTPGTPAPLGAEPRPVRGLGLGPLLRRRPLLAAYGAALVWTAGIGTLVVHLPLVLDARGVPASVRGGAFAVYALVALVLMAGPAPYLANRLGRLPPLAGGLALIGTALLWLSFGGSTGAVYGAMALFGLGFGLLFPAATALVADATIPAERASAFGIFYAAYSLGVVGGEVGSGLLAGRFGPASGAPFLAAAVLAFAAAPLVLLAVRGHPVPTDPFPAAPSPSRAQ